MENTIYLDHNATTPPLPEVIAAVFDTMGLFGANPSSIHTNGRAARSLVEDARDSVAALVGAEPEAVVFTSGGSESNNTAIMCAGLRRILVSPTEHVAVLKTVLTRSPNSVIIPVDRDGLVCRAGDCNHQRDGHDHGELGFSEWSCDSYGESGRCIDHAVPNELKLRINR